MGAIPALRACSGQEPWASSGAKDFLQAHPLLP